jgi:DNA-binding CsgD family transcriptional regulator
MAATLAMTTAARKQLRPRPEKMAEFLEASYCLETDDETWLAEVMDRARAVWGRGGPAHGAIYDASDVTAFQVKNAHLIDFSAEGVDCIMRGLKLFTEDLVIRTFRSLLAGISSTGSVPEMRPMLNELRALGILDALNINGLDPSGQAVFMAFWMRQPVEPSRAEMALYRRMAHHLAAAYRCRRRLRESQIARSSIEATDGAEAILDVRRRIVHATGLAKENVAQNELIETAKARDLARTSNAQADEGLRRWRPLTSARWTLIDTFERGGARYIVARENQTEVPGLASLSDRERQAVAYLAVGQSTKETAYALGISDVTVRVLIARAASKLGVRSRADLLEHPEVRVLRPVPSPPPLG